MSSRSSSAPLPKPRNTALPASDLCVLPRDLGALFAQRPLIQGESADEYDDLLSRVTRAVAPADVIEAVWVKDIVDLIWEAQRLRRLKASLLMAARKQAVIHLLQANHAKLGPLAFGKGDRYSDTVNRWLAGDTAAERTIRSLLAECGLELESVMAQALANHLRRVERIDQMIVSAEARRHKVLAEIERRREALARRLRTASDTVIAVA
jgi:hypothetical protein